MRRCLVLTLAGLLVASTARGLDIYVATNGNDAWSGALAEPNAAKTDGPFATVERARDEIRKIKKQGGLPEGGVVVEVLGGRYELARPISLTAEDSGTAESPIIYRARPGAEVRISGGKIITGWRPVTDPEVLTRLEPEARGKVFQTDLKAQGIAQYGELGIDAAANLQAELARENIQGEFTMGSVAALPGMKAPERLEVFFNDEPMPISRWPNDGFIKIEEMLGSTIRDVRGTKSCVEGIFQYEGDRPKRWVGEKDEALALVRRLAAEKTKNEFDVTNTLRRTATTPIVNLLQGNLMPLSPCILNELMEKARAFINVLHFGNLVPFHAVLFAVVSDGVVLLLLMGNRSGFYYHTFIAVT